MNLPLTLAECNLIYRADLMSFIERSFLELNPETRFSSSRHLEVMASKLDLCRQGKLRRLIVNLPPRSLKSHSISVALVAWMLGHDPAAQIICASYGQDLSEKHARDCRTLMLSDFYRQVFQGTRISTVKHSVNEFMTTKQGYRLSTSVGGGVTGRGGDVIILDDPQKPEEAMSETKRKSVNEWFDNTVLSRLNNKETGVMIIVMQRLHQDDLVGHVLEQGNWEVLSFPAIAEKNETHVIESALGRRYFHRCEGEALHPERESLETLAVMRASIGEYNFSSQYQQDPVPEGGSIVKAAWLRFYEPGTEPAFAHIVQSWDTANKTGELNDYSVCTTWGVDGRRTYYLLDVFRRRLDFPGLKKAFLDQARKYDPHLILVEDKASGTQLIQEMREEGVYSVKAAELVAGADKVVRLYAQTTLFESGAVQLLKGAPWLPEYLREFAAFPDGKHDDQVDSTTQALEYFRLFRKPTIYDFV